MPMASAKDEQPPTPEEDDSGELVDALPVLAHEASVLDDPFVGELSRSPVALPAVQAAAVAAGGFVAGAAVVGLVARRHRRALGAGKGRRRLSRRRKPGPSAGELVQIVGSRSLLVDVHLLGGRG
ncbi:MAG: hypothetical protein QOF54_1043 [Solirubrobacteraceae bacterium]|jgi:hypothetical protein|nr:hypothetical protein [Solirubrobacteraceae bacterium]